MRRIHTKNFGLTAAREAKPQTVGMRHYPNVREQVEIR